MKISEIKARAAEDLDFFAACLIPDVTTEPFPPFYHTVWTYIIQNIHSLSPETIFRFALGLPRGHAKTTFMKLLVCYLIIHNYKIHFIEIVCATEPLAQNFLADVHSMLSSHIVKEVWFNWEASLTRNTLQVKMATLQGRKFILVAIGAGTATRGLNLDNARPNIILLDDAQTKENDQSDTDRTKLLTWMLGTLFKSLTKRGKKAILYIGNMYSTECILYKFSKSKTWTSLITGAILADGSALWPAINTTTQLLNEYLHDSELGMGHIWFAEVQNDPVGATNGLIPPGTTIPAPTTDYGTLDAYPARFITVDPAGSKLTADDNVVATHCLLDGQKAGTIAIEHGKWSPKKVIDVIISSILTHKVNTVFIESQGYQASLSFWLEERLRELQILDVRVYPIPTGRAAKLRRIRDWTRLWLDNQWELLAQDVYSKVTFQLYSFKVDRTDNVDDILDCQAQGVLAINRYGQQIRQNAYRAVDTGKAASVVSSNTVLDLV